MPPLVLKARHQSGSAFCWSRQWYGFPLGLGLINLLNFHGKYVCCQSCTCLCAFVVLLSFVAYKIVPWFTTIYTAYYVYYQSPWYY